MEEKLEKNFTHFDIFFWIDYPCTGSVCDCDTIFRIFQNASIPGYRY